jgi:cytochrome P450
MLGGHYVPGGTGVGVPVHALHFSSKHFSPDPEKFEPRRWLPSKDGEEKFETDESALITFSFGLSLVDISK